MNCDDSHLVWSWCLLLGRHSGWHSLRFRYRPNCSARFSPTQTPLYCCDDGDDDDDDGGGDDRCRRCVAGELRFVLPVPPPPPLPPPLPPPEPTAGLPLQTKTIYQ